MGVRIGIDTGGTFTDLIGLDEATGGLVFGKTSSTPGRTPSRNGPGLRPMISAAASPKPGRGGRSTKR